MRCPNSLVLFAVLFVATAHAEEYPFTRDEAVKQLVAHLKVTKDARLGEEDAKKVVAHATELIKKFAKEILPEKLSAVSKEAFDLMFAYPIELKSDDDGYLNDTLPMWVSVVLSHVRYQRLYPTLSPEGLAELRGNISTFISGMRTALRKDDRIDPAIIDSVLADLEKEMSGAVNNPNVWVYRVPIEKGKLEAFMKEYEEKVMTKLDASIREISPAHDPESRNKAVRAFVRYETSRAAGKFAHLAKPPELEKVDMEKLNPGHSARIAAFGKADSRVFEKNTRRQMDEIQQRPPRN